MSGADPQQPLEILIHSQNTKESITLSIIKSVPFNLSSVSSHLIHNYNYNSRPIQQINTNKSRLFSSNNPLLIEKAQHSPFLVKLSFQLKDQYGILTHLRDNKFIINYISSLIDFETGLNFSSSSYDHDIITDWKGIICETPKNSYKLSMKPPVQSSPSKSDATDNIKDPFDYFVDKYFDTLYQLTTSLIFFAKSAFSRLKTLCANMDPPVSYESTLRQFLISFESFDARHLISNNGILNSTPMFEVEAPFRDEFISKSLNLVDFDIHSINYSDTNKSLVDLLNNFKLREIQLQIMILLELISTTNRDGPIYFKEPTKKKSLTKKRLVGRRKVTPIMNGSAISTELPSTDSTDMSNYNLIFDSFVDKLCIWEMLNSSTSNVNNDHTSGKFISYVLLPYFEKGCPNSIKRLIKKVKGPSFKSSMSSSSSSKPKSENPARAIGLKRTSSNSESISGDIKKPTLTRSSSILEGLDELRPQRSNSDLQTLKRTSSLSVSSLSKRQVDISRPQAPSSQEIASRSNSLSIFNRVGKKILSTSSKLQTDIVVSQVEDTPVKKQRVIDVIETPQDSQKQKGSTLNINSSSSPVEYLSTPAALQSPLIIRSTVKKPGEQVFEFKSPEDSRLKGSPSSRVRRKLFAPR